MEVDDLVHKDESLLEAIDVFKMMNFLILIMDLMHWTVLFLFQYINVALFEKIKYNFAA